MDNTTYHLIIVVAGALITALSYFLVKMSIHLKDSVPADVANVLLNLLTDLASRTVTTEDDELVQKLRELLEAQATVQKGFDGKP